jgi:hypothetical protein
MKRKKKKNYLKTKHLFISPDSKTRQNKTRERKQNPLKKNIVFKTYISLTVSPYWKVVE